MYLSIILLPLLSSFLAVNRNSGKGGPILSAVCLMCSAILTLIVFFEVGFSGAPIILSLGNWIDNGNILIEWSLLFDTLTVSMYLPVCIISFLIQVYSLEYMGSDPHKSRFFSLLSLFSFAMLMLVTGENLLILLLGWELVGLVSYLLISFWYTRIDANHGGLKALFINKIGDWLLVLGLIIAVAIFSDLSLGTIFSMAASLNGDLLLILCICFIGAAAAKSAMVGLHVWLYSAMEGPTSVSALLHSSTMVTAGVFLLIKVSPLLEFSSTSLMLIVWLGSLGALLGAAYALTLTDLKKVIASSTLSQLGYMIVAVGLSQYSLALFHLLTHAFFKSLLFLASGCIIHAIIDVQDVRRMGALNILTPITYLVFLFGSLSLMAFPFSSGFYSKDLILEILISPNSITHSIAYIFTLLGALLTSTYSIRLMMMAMLSRPSFPKAIIPFVTDSPMLMTLPMLILSIGAIILGYLGNELFLCYGSEIYLNSIFTHPSHLLILDAPFAASNLALIPLCFLLLIFIILIISPIPSTPTPNIKTIKLTNSGLLVSISKSKSKSNSNSNSNSETGTESGLDTGHNFTYTTSALNHFNIFNLWVMHSFLILSVYLYRYIDKGILEILGPLGFTRLLQFLGFYIEYISTGNIAHYSLILIGFVGISSFLILI